MSGILLPAGCCCGCSDTPCVYCSDRTPTIMRVTFSGVSWCTNCAYYSGSWTASKKWTTYPATLAGPYDCTQIAACEWEYSAASSGKITHYTDAGCSAGGVAYDQTLKVRVELISLTTIRLTAGFFHDTPPPHSPGYQFPFHSGWPDVTRTTSCGGPWVITNSIAASLCTATYNMWNNWPTGYGGVGTVVAVCK